MNLSNDWQFAKTHLQERHLQIDRYNGVFLSEDVITFLLWNLSGQCVGFQQYRPFAGKEKSNDPKSGRYYTIRSKPHLAVWGLESYNYRSDILIITEGIFDACRFHNFNIPAIALLSNSFLPYANFLLTCGRKIYKVDDNHSSELGPFENLQVPSYRNDAGECTEIEIFDVIKGLI